MNSDRSDRELPGSRSSMRGPMPWPRPSRSPWRAAPTGRSWRRCERRPIVGGPGRSSRGRGRDPPPGGRMPDRPGRLLDPRRGGGRGPGRRGGGRGPRGKGPAPGQGDGGHAGPDARGARPRAWPEGGPGGLPGRLDGGRRPRPAVPPGRHRDLRQAEARDQGRHRRPRRGGRPKPRRGGPRVAIMAASESVNASMPETVDAADSPAGTARATSPAPSSRARSRSTWPIPPTPAARSTSMGRSSAGPTRWSFPDLLSANLTVKAIMYTARHAEFGGVLQRQPPAPVAFMSRSDTAETRLNSLALALAILVERRGAPDARRLKGDDRGPWFDPRCLEPVTSGRPDLPAVGLVAGLVAGVEVLPGSTIETQGGGPGLDLGQPAS